MYAPGGLIQFLHAHGRGSSRSKETLAGRGDFSSRGLGQGFFLRVSGRKTRFFSGY
jgi:hypothetical protein